MKQMVSKSMAWPEITAYCAHVIAKLEKHI